MAPLELSELISAYIDGELQDEQRQRAERLIETDAAARALHEQFLALRDSLRSLPQQRIEHELAPDVIEVARHRRAQLESPEEEPAAADGNGISEENGFSEEEAADRDDSSSPGEIPAEATAAEVSLARKIRREDRRFTWRTLAWPLLATAAAVLLMVGSRMFEPAAQNGRMALKEPRQKAAPGGAPHDWPHRQPELGSVPDKESQLAEASPADDRLAADALSGESLDASYSDQRESQQTGQSGLQVAPAAPELAAEHARRQRAAGEPNSSTQNQLADRKQPANRFAGGADKLLAPPAPSAEREASNAMEQPPAAPYDSRLQDSQRDQAQGPLLVVVQWSQHQNSEDAVKDWLATQNVAWAPGVDHRRKSLELAKAGLAASPAPGAAGKPAAAELDGAAALGNQSLAAAPRGERPAPSKADADRSPQADSQRTRPNASALSQESKLAKESQQANLGAGPAANKRLFTAVLVEAPPQQLARLLASLESGQVRGLQVERYLASGSGRKAEKGSLEKESDSEQRAPGADTLARRLAMQSMKPQSSAEKDESVAKNKSSEQTQRRAANGIRQSNGEKSAAAPPSKPSAAAVAQDTASARSELRHAGRKGAGSAGSATGGTGPDASESSTPNPPAVARWVTVPAEMLELSGLAAQQRAQAADPQALADDKNANRDALRALPAPAATEEKGNTFGAAKKHPREATPSEQADKQREPKKEKPQAPYRDEKQSPPAESPEAAPLDEQLHLERDEVAEDASRRDALAPSGDGLALRSRGTAGATSRLLIILRPASSSGRTFSPAAPAPLAAEAVAKASDGPADSKPANKSKPNESKPAAEAEPPQQESKR